MTAILLDTVRHSYDLIGKLAERQAIVFLTNTNRSGGEVVLNRFHSQLLRTTTAECFPHLHHQQVPPGTPKGKSRVLNYGVSVTD